MATAPPTNPTSTRPVSQPFRLPPDEALWTRYSPHGEAPLSFVGSMAMHILAVVLLVLVAVVAYTFFNPPAKSLPVDVVRMPGGGGGNPHGQGDAPGNGGGGEVVDGPASREPTDPEQEKRPPLTVDEANKVKAEFGDVGRAIADGGIENLKKLARLDPDIQKRLRDGVNPGKGKGGNGQGGGNGPGSGVGTGSGTGSGGELSQRERRMLRWQMMFSTRSGQDYVAQLHDLGAIVGIPVNRDGKKYLTCDLTKQPFRFVEDDLKNNTRIWWHDDNPDSVKKVMRELGYNGVPPSHFLAFMPEDLEKKMYQMELSYKGLSEEEVEHVETKFRCFQSPATRKFDVRVDSQTPVK
jgi:hypothetical protein